MYKLVCMSFDGEYVTERPTFKTLQEVADYDNDMGSRWYFYPFHFPVTESGKTIADSFFPVEFLKGKRVKSVSKMFAEEFHRADDLVLDVDIDLFLMNVADANNR